MTAAPAPARRGRYLRPSEVAELLGVDPKTVAVWAHAGKLPGARTLGGHWRFPEAAVRALAATRRFEPPPRGTTP